MKKKGTKKKEKKEENISSLYKDANLKKGD
jgi:hypothetical protein